MAPVVFTGLSHETPLFERAKLEHGNRIAGPAILVEYSSTLVLPPDWSLQVDPCGHLLMDAPGDRS
jgi:N-methylhydantoinase A